MIMQYKNHLVAVAFGLILSAAYSCGTVQRNNSSSDFVGREIPFSDIVGTYFDTGSTACRCDDETKPLVWLTLKSDLTCEYTEATCNSTVKGIGTWKYLSPNFYNDIEIDFEAPQKTLSDSIQGIKYLDDYFMALQVIDKNKLRTHTFIFKKVSDKEAKKRIECK